MAVLTIHFDVQSANAFINSITDPNAPKYIFVSKPTPWTDAQGNYNDTIVLATDPSIVQTESFIYNDLVFGKQITSDDVMNMIPRYNWAGNTVYTKFSNLDANLYSEQFFIVTDDLNVYKCIDNNYGSISTVKPTVTATSGTFSTSDGYIWKYMFTVPSDDDLKFSTSAFIPCVPNNSVMGNAVPGSVDVIDLTSFGNGYAAYYQGFLENSINNFVVAIDANASPFSNFYVGSSMYLKSGFGAGQIRQIVSYDGLNKLIRVDSPFNVYSTMSLSGASGNFNVGDTILQSIDNLFISFVNGLFQIGDTVVQSDTGASGTILTANSTELQVFRTTPNKFTLNTPIYNTTQFGTLKSGNVSVASFTTLTLLSNSGTFIPGEFLFESNGTANVGTGTLFSAQSLPNTTVQFTPSTNLVGSFIKLGSNPFSLKQQLLYYTAAGNTAIFGLSNNTIYYVSFFCQRKTSCLYRFAWKYSSNRVSKWHYLLCCLC
jgi:hypothetical protein